jgi:hypothetical protein
MWAVRQNQSHNENNASYETIDVTTETVPKGMSVAGLKLQAWGTHPSFLQPIWWINILAVIHCKRQEKQ